MKNTTEEYGENGELNPNNTAMAQNQSVKTPGNESFEHSAKDPNNHKGSQALADRYNINDKAHTDSSEHDFIKTVSNFHHADTTDTDAKNDTTGDSRHHS